MRKDRSSLKTAVPTEELKEKIGRLRTLAYAKASLREEVLEKIINPHPKQLKRICETEYKYVCISQAGNMLTFFASVSRKEFKWWASFATINEAVIAVKTKFAEHNIFVGSIKKF